jgi:hypothetical protein
MRKHLRGLVAAAACSVVLVGATPAGAHSAGVHYPVHWGVGQSVPTLYAPSYPGGEFRSRVGSAISQWNTRAGTNEPKFWQAGNAASEVSITLCNPDFSTPNQIHYKDLDSYGGGVLGITYSCWRTSDRRMISFQLTIDNDRDWYTGTGDANDGFLQACVPSCQHDLWSVLSHEFGHATGFIGGPDNGHIGESDSACPESDSRSTMCPSVAPGTERQRTLELHDYHTFQAAY